MHTTTVHKQFNTIVLRNCGEEVAVQGVDTDYDDAEGRVKDIEADLAEYLQQIRQQLGGSKELCYVTVNKDVNLMEIPQVGLTPGCSVYARLTCAHRSQTAVVAPAALQVVFGLDQSDHCPVRHDKVHACTLEPAHLLQMMAHCGMAWRA